MQLSRTRGFRVSVADYETMEFSATVTINHRDLGYADDEVESLAAGDPNFTAALLEQIQTTVEAELDKLLEPELEEARRTAVPGRSAFLPSRSETQRRRTI